jgi:hypothetical protein
MAGCELPELWGAMAYVIDPARFRKALNLRTNCGSFDRAILVKSLNLRGISAILPVIAGPR